MGVLATEAAGKILRLIPPGTRGKNRLAQALVRRRSRLQQMVVRDRFGNLMSIPNAVEPVGAYLWMDGVYEPDTLQFIQSNLDAGSCFLDVGANIGVFTVQIAAAFPEEQVLAIEASPTVGKFLKDNVSLNRLKNVTVVECAVSSGEHAQTEFYEPPADHFGMGSIAPQFGVKPIRVEARSIDAILDQSSVRRVSIMKVDVEGYESEVFAGAQRLLSSAQAPKIIFEFCDWAEGRAFPKHEGLAQEALLNCGYRLWRLSDYAGGGPPLNEPLRSGSESIVAIRQQQ